MINQSLIRSVKSASQSMCIAECLLECSCYMSDWTGELCNLYNFSARGCMIVNNTKLGFVYLKKDNTGMLAERISRDFKLVSIF